MIEHPDGLLSVNVPEKVDTDVPLRIPFKGYKTENGTGHFYIKLSVSKYENIDEVIKQINSTGFGLTLGIQSRINARVEYICKRVNIGNIYVNRTMIGAVVGVQPFGGEGLSGTGPKAGGPNYLLRFTTERTYTENTTAIGGNYTLLS